MSGIRRLVDYPWVLVRVRCEMCKRAGAYRVARLAVKYGVEILLDDLIVRLSSDCPWRDEPRGSCGARFSVPFAWLWRAWHGVGRLIRRG